MDIFDLPRYTVHTATTSQGSKYATMKADLSGLFLRIDELEALGKSVPQGVPRYTLALRTLQRRPYATAIPFQKGSYVKVLDMHEA